LVNLYRSLGYAQASVYAQAWPGARQYLPPAADGNGASKGPCHPNREFARWCNRGHNSNISQCCDRALAVFCVITLGAFMFTRSSAPEPKTLEPMNNNLGLNVQRRPPMTDTSNKSVISNDLKIIGQGLKIISQGTLQVDGEVEGDVRGAEVIIGEKGRVTGTVAAERVIVRGMISGVIRGMTVTLQASSRVEGDIHHMSLAIEQGAEFDGRCRRPADASELNLDLDGSPVAAMPQPRPVVQRPGQQLRPG
jgi:cytoskeletal protein CcmA (bactofilin family)